MPDSQLRQRNPNVRSILSIFPKILSDQWERLRRRGKTPHRTGGQVLGRGAGAVLLVLFLAGTAAAENGAPETAPMPQQMPQNEASPIAAFGPGEMFSYDISWAGISSGNARMAVENGVSDTGLAVYRLISEAHSNRAVSLFYPVKDHIVSQVNQEGIPLRIDIDQRHGRRIRDLNVVFDQARHIATTTKHINGTDDVTVSPIPPRAHDILSCLYYVRNMRQLEPGQTVQIDVHEGRKNWSLLIHVEGRERIGVPAGSFDTLRVRAEVKFEGVFVDRGDVHLWLTDDHHHMPVQVEVKIKIGTVVLALTGYELAPPVARPSSPMQRMSPRQ